MGLSIRTLFVRLAVVAALSVAASALAQATAIQTAPPAIQLVEPPAPLLPHVAPFLDSDAAHSVPADSDSWQPIAKEDGIVAQDARALASGWIKAYQFVDATGARSAYSYLRQGARPANGTKINDSQVVSPAGDTIFLAGTVVVVAHLSTTPNAAAVLKAAETSLPKITGRKALQPLLPKLFPANVGGMQPDLTSMRYSLGPLGYQAMGGKLPAAILGWDKSVEIATVGYSGRGAHGTLTLLWYPTPQIAADRGRAIEKAINDIGPASFGTVKFRRVGPLLGLTNGQFTPDQAEKLVQALHLNEEITFDQKMPVEFHAEVRKTATLLEEVIAFTGLLTIAAVVIAVFLGGGRAGWRVLHGKSAASEPEFLSINLRDEPKQLFTPKEVDPKDPPV